MPKTQVRIKRNYTPVRIRDQVDYEDVGRGAWGRRSGWARFQSEFLDPMVDSLKKSLRDEHKNGATSALEIGPGGGRGSDTALTTGFSKVGLVEVNPHCVSKLATRYAKLRFETVVEIYEGDSRDVLGDIPTNSYDVSFIIDNSLSNMQEPREELDGIAIDFRTQMLTELLRISRRSVLIGLSSTDLTPVYEKIYRDQIAWRGPHGIVVMYDGMVSAQYTRDEVHDLISSVPNDGYVIKKSRGVFWCTITPPRSG